jgi:cytochrome c oxidase subunit 4
MIGVYVGLAMIVLTAIEYWIGTSASPSVVFLFLISIAKSALVIYFFMHIYRLWRPEGSH